MDSLREVILTTLVGTALIAILAWIVGVSRQESRTCEARGGVLVKGVDRSTVCVQELVDR